MDGTKDVYVNKSASSSLAFNLSFTIILTIFPLIHGKSRCDQKDKKKLQQSTWQFTEKFYNNLALNPGILSVIGPGIGEFTQQDVSKKSTKRLYVTKVTGLLHTSFVVIFT